MSEDTLNETLDPDEEGDDSINTPAGTPQVSEDDLADVDEQDDDDEPDA